MTKRIDLMGKYCKKLPNNMDDPYLLYWFWFAPNIFNERNFLYKISLHRTRRVALEGRRGCCVITLGVISP